MVVVEYSDNVNSGKLLFKTRNNGGSETTADCGVTVATNTLYTVTISMNEARSEARCYISTAAAMPTLTTITATMPNAVAVGARGGMFASVGTTTKPGNFSCLSAFVQQ